MMDRQCCCSQRESMRRPLVQGISPEPVCRAARHPAPTLAKLAPAPPEMRPRSARTSKNPLPQARFFKDGVLPQSSQHLGHRLRRGKGDLSSPIGRASARAGEPIAGFAVTAGTCHPTVRDLTSRLHSLSSGDESNLAPQGLTHRHVSIVREGKDLMKSHEAFQIGSAPRLSTLWDLIP